MISFDQIVLQYPENLRPFRESILKEYLQVKILKSIFEQKYSEKLAFLGGTALRIIHGNTRFSEDLDFDNSDPDERAFIHLGEHIKKDLELEGLQVEITFVTKRAYRHYDARNGRVSGLQDNQEQQKPQSHSRDFPFRKDTSFCIRIIAGTHRGIWRT